MKKIILMLLMPNLMQSTLFSMEKSASSANELNYTFFTMTLKNKNVRSIAFNEDSATIFMGLENGDVCLFTIDRQENLKTFKGHADLISSVAFNPDKKTILTGSYDKTARLWDVETGQELKRFVEHAGPITSVAFSPDGKTVLTGAKDGTAWLWDVDTGKGLKQFNGYKWEEFYPVEFSTNGNTFLEGSRASSAKPTSLSKRDIFNCLTFSSEEKTFFAGLNKGRVFLRSVKDKAIIKEFQGHEGNVYSVALSPDGKTILTGSEDALAILWDVNTGEELKRFIGHTQAILAVAFSPDGKTILTGSEDGTACLWDVNTGEQLQKFSEHNCSVCSVAFSPSSLTIALVYSDGWISFCMKEQQAQAPEVSLDNEGKASSTQGILEDSSQIDLCLLQ